MLSTYAQTTKLQQQPQPRLQRRRTRLRRRHGSVYPRRPPRLRRRRGSEYPWRPPPHGDVEKAVVMEELENMEELETAEEWQEANLLVRSSAGGVAKGIVPWPPTQLILASR